MTAYEQIEAQLSDLLQKQGEAVESTDADSLRAVLARDAAYNATLAAVKALAEDAERWRIARRDGFQDIGVLNRDAQLITGLAADRVAD